MRPLVKYSVVTALLAFSSGILLWGQTINATVDATRISMGETVTFKIETVDSDEMPTVDISPILSQFHLVSGPGQQTNIQWVNGRMTSSRVLSWTFTPKKSGILMIPKLSVTLGKKTYQTTSVKIQVAKGADGEEANIFIRAELDKESAYMGEQITVTYKLYRSANFSPSPYTLPTFTGFWSEVVYTPRSLKFRNVTLKGKSFQAADLYKVALFPTKTGQLTIPSLTVKGQMEKKTNRRARRSPVFDPFFDSFFTETVTKQVRSPEKQINIKSYPAMKPYDFSGAVGSFKLSSTVDADSVNVNEGFTYTVRLKGTGNMGQFSLPDIQFPETVEAFPPKEKFKKDPFRDALTGTMTWEYILIPRKAGSLFIPRVSMSFFDPQTGTWDKTETKGIDISVMAGKESHALSGEFTKREVELLGQDIRFIHNDNPKWLPIQRSIVSRSILWIYGFVFLLLLMPGWIHNATDYRLSTESGRVSRGAVKKARKSLNQTTEDPFSLASQTLYTYLYERLHLSTPNLDSNQIKETLDGLIPEALLLQMITLVNQCDSGRFAPGGEALVETILSDTKSLIIQLDKALA
ncbi:MAG: protein BatD [Candidatus Marinimicrobia bacterium]|nr:protein BatD [Candidatus Neomarinimicrobiota bacterium]